MDQYDHGHDDICLGLGLGLGLSEYTPKKDNTRNNKRLFFFDLSIPFPQSDDHGSSPDSSSNLKIIGEGNNQGSKEDDDSNCSREFSRKKLRLTREQTTLLEDSFKQHSTLNTAQKQLLAERLNLKPRQVEVWFQNRRARTKLKQTEVDCQYLKKNCERLTDENRRLKKEVFELRSLLKIERPVHPPSTLVAPPPFFRQNPKAASASGERNGKNRGGGEKQDGGVMKVVRQP